MRELGAGEVVVQGGEPVAEALRRLVPEGVDGILDAVGDRAANRALAAVVRDGGAFWSTAFGLADEPLADLRIRTDNYRLDRKPERLAEIGALVLSGTVRPVVGATIGLDAGVAALCGRTEVAGLRGKTVVKVR
ncbi:zinc-binding alcohol dehydrogenase family protein [Amycolatopsis sulphurea]|uniref:Zinc-binding alcohol dehydrogenase family protein n=1 Tax=Amycolatopsis sulphurea TaxID=76022 RepID=A0A2A9FJT0_9PSEU|nr:zinc-binding dehydrogenase [Amycolatopsis sulphurea]PFG51016.1 zinc-binding alcohol dehydrogenase family protein [Amycolatopsis sulphurea]